MKSLLWLSLSATLAFAQNAKPTQVKPGLYRVQLPKLGEWEINRYTTDAAGKKTKFCSAINIQASEVALRFTYSDKLFTFAFMGEASGAIGQAPKLTYWFGDAKTAPKSTRVGKLIESEEEGVEWMLLETPIATPNPDLDQFLNSPTVRFSYTWEGKAIVSKYSLKGANAALKKIMECSKL